MIGIQQTPGFQHFTLHCMQDATRLQVRLLEPILNV